MTTVPTILGRMALALAPLLAACGEHGEPPGKPDVFLIVCDTLRADAILDPEGRYDTPRLDELASDGVVFTRAFAHAPMTLPSHTALFSSRPPFETGVWNNGEDVPADLPLLAEWMRDHGYRTRAVLSMASVGFASRAGLARGFEHADIDFWRMSRGEEVAERAAAALRASSGDRPLFCFVHYCDPHEPYNAHGATRREAEVLLDGQVVATLTTSDMSLWFHDVDLSPGRHEFVVRSKHPFRLRSFEVREQDRDLPVNWDLGQRLEAIREARMSLQRETAGRCQVRLWINDVPVGRERNTRYASEVAYADACIGRFLDELRAAGRYDDALIIFTSDHGESLGERDHWGHVHDVNDPLVHVPLIVKLPSGDPHASLLAARANSLVPLADLAPTILEIAGVPPLPGARGTPIHVEHGALLITETHRPEARKDMLALRDDEYKMVFLPEEGRFLLYDLELDPGEERDVFAEQKDARPDWPAQLEGLAKAGQARRQGGAPVDENTLRELEALGY